ncbi:transcriptional regulator [Streptomyces fructofermentans]|uniref:transcriptional regulator n=1 Tax=Streptomyces fructofermentans TaxID=152141 RepID=UPI0037A2A057
MSTRDEDVERFAALLRGLKARTDRSYGALARRVPMNTSTLHRYCAGEAVPLDFAPVERFAVHCGATPEERIELHRRWMSAVAARQRPRTSAAPEGSGPAGSGDPSREPAAAGPEPSDGQAPGGADGNAAPDAPGGAARGASGGVDGTSDGESRGEGRGPADGSGSSGGGEDSGAGPGSAEEHGPTESGGEAPPVAGVSGGEDRASDGPSGGEHGSSERGDADGGCAGGASAEGGGAEGGGAEGGSRDGSRTRDRGPGGESGRGAGAARADAPARPAVPSADGPGPESRPPSGRHRRRFAVAAAAAATLLVTIGGLSALTAGGSSDDTGRAPGRAPATSAPAGPRNPSGIGSPTATGPSSSPEPGTKASPSPSGPSARPSGKATANGTGTAAVPLTWTANSQVWALGCDHDYVIGKEPDRVPPPPAAQDAGAWAATQNAVHGGETVVRISVQGRSSTAVVLEELRVRVVGRSAPVRGNVFAMNEGCGGSLTPRSFSVDLDKDRPVVRSLAGSDAGSPIPAMRMPYRVSDEDPEVLLVTAGTKACDCRWYLELDWSSQGRTGTVRVDDGGRPFRTSGIGGLPRYAYDTSGRHWSPWSD